MRLFGKDTFLFRSALTCAGLSCWVGCAVEVAPDEAAGMDDDAPAHVEVAATEQPLTGVVNTTSCDATEQRVAQLAVQAGRFVAASVGFKECLTNTMAFSSNLWHGGAARTSRAGPYNAYSGDPYRAEVVNTQINVAWYASQSTSDVNITCGGTGESNVFGSAMIGSYAQDRDSAESMLVDELWGAWAAKPGATNGGTTAELFQLTHAVLANTVWHEGMHQWGYQHAGGAFQLSFLNTVPYIVGDCMETVMRQSASNCAAMTCPPFQRPVKRFFDPICQCIMDPQYDVGVLLQPGATCPGIPGRAGGFHVELRMDDEDDDNANSTSGWIGQTVSDTNTRFKFCVVSGTRFAPLKVSALSSTAPKNYAVVRMGASCPPNSVSMYRYFDNEDDDNENSSIGHVAPHISRDSGTVLELCMFKETTGSTGSTAPFSNLGASYGVFAPANFPGAISTGYLRTDDEDDDNRNAIGGLYAGSQVFLQGGDNTRLFTARVK